MTGEQYPDGGGGEGSEFWMVWMSARTNGNTTEDAITYWNEHFPGREDEAVVGADWEEGLKHGELATANG
jgi:hypothetical protein